MAVILTNVDVPKNCTKCEIKVSCKELGREWAEHPDGRYSLGVNERIDECQMKSVEGLIKRLKTLEESCASDSYGRAMAHAMDTAIREVKKYCGMEDA